MQIVVNWMCRASNLSISQSHGLCTAQTRICAVTMMIIYYIPIGGDNAAVLQTIAKENLIGISTSTRNILIAINCYCTVYCGWWLDTPPLAAELQLTAAFAERDGYS